MTQVRSTAVVTQIDCKVAPYDWAFVRDEAQRIEECWADLRSQKPGLFDGPVLMARDVAIAGDVLTGRAFVVGYKPFLCWRELGYPDAPVSNIFAMPALLSSDGAFLLGRMSSGTANAGRLYFPAGTPDPSDLAADGRIDFESSILRELEEETGLTSADVALDPTWTVLRADPLVACIKIARASLPVADLETKIAGFIAAQQHPELDGTHRVTGPEDYDPVRMPPFMLHYLDGALRRVEVAREDQAR